MDYVVEAVFPVHRHFRQSFFVQEQDVAIFIHNLLNRRCFTLLQDTLEASVHFLCHRNLAGTGIDLGAFNVNRHASALRLVVDVNDSVLHIRVSDDQSTDLGNSHSGVEQYENHLIVLAVDIVIMYNLQELAHLIRLDCLAGNTVVYNTHQQTESRMDFSGSGYHPRPSRKPVSKHRELFYGAITLAVLLQLDKKKLYV